MAAFVPRNAHRSLRNSHNYWKPLPEAGHGMQYKMSRGSVNTQTRLKDEYREWDSRRCLQAARRPKTLAGHEAGKKMRLVLNVRLEGSDDPRDNAVA